VSNLSTVVALASMAVLCAGACSQARAEDASTIRDGFPAWVNYPGPAGSFPANGSMLWVVRPTRKNWSSLEWTRADYVRTEGPNHIVSAPLFDGQHHTFYPELAVPQAMSCAADPKAVFAAGDVVVIPAAATRHDFGRVTKVERQGGRTVLTVKSRWVSVIEGRYAPDEVLKLDGKPGCGARVLYTQDGELGWGLLVRVVGDKGWLIRHNLYNAELASVPVKDLKPFDLSKVFKKGAPVYVKAGDHTLAPAQVVEVLDGGLGYKVKRVDCESCTSEFDFEDVIAR